jgi:hypothetical protein
MYVCVCVCVCIHIYTLQIKYAIFISRVLYIDDGCLYISYRFMPKLIVQMYKFTSHKARNLTSYILPKRIYSARN